MRDYVLNPILIKVAILRLYYIFVNKILVYFGVSFIYAVSQIISRIIWNGMRGAQWQFLAFLKRFVSGFCRRST